MLYDTPEKLHALTGYRRTSDHIRWCQANGVRFMRVKRGIVVASAWIESAFGDLPQAPAQGDPQDTREWFDAHWREWMVRPSEIIPGPVSEAPDDSGVYFLFLDDRIVYVGRSNNIARRLREHAAEGTAPVEQAAWVLCPVCWAPTVESFYLNLYEPPLNTARGLRLLMWTAAEKLCC